MKVMLINLHFQYFFKSSMFNQKCNFASCMVNMFNFLSAYLHKKSMSTNFILDSVFLVNVRRFQDGVTFSVSW